MKGSLGDVPGRCCLALLLLGTACLPVAESNEASSAAVVNGKDDRIEFFELEDAEERYVIQRGVAALMWVHRVDAESPKQLRATSAGAALGLCDGEPFAEQPSASFCSATLIDDDLVLTAGHCLGDGEAEAADRCQRLWIVFDYHYAQVSRLALDAADDIFACRQVVYHRHESREDGFVDVAILQLDRPVSSDRARVAIASARPRVGDALLAATHGVGLPLKVDRGGSVIEIQDGANHLVASTDSFVGGSGAPLFDASLALVGYQVRGDQDWVDDGSCVRATHAEEPSEEHQLAQVAIDALCDGGWPSSALCEKTPRCGDQVCGGHESHEACGEDCPAPRCGDGVCEFAERASCEPDCSPYSYVPAEWSADPVSYGGPAPVTEGEAELKARGGCAVQTPSAHGASSVPALLLAWGLVHLRNRRRATGRHTAGCRWRTKTDFRL